MQRLTTDKPVNEMNNMELAYNCCIAANGEAVYRDFERTVGARKMIFKLLDYYGVEGFTAETDDELDEYMVDSLMDGPFTMAGMIAIIYRFIWAMAGIRGRLKQYEDTGLDPKKIFEMDRLYAEKCRELAETRKSHQYDLKVGDVLYFACFEPNFPEQSEVSKSIVKDVSVNGLVLLDDCEMWIDWKDPEENMFLTRKEAEVRIEEMIRNGRE